MHFLGLAKMVKNRRKMLDVNQEMLAELSGVSLRSLKQFETGKGTPTLKTIAKIVDSLGLELTLKVKDLNSDK